jgi:2-polyprenyl-3-methyl-5-hydroxy-6-metoxy-1,4-benzoquinol methylase
MTDITLNSDAKSCPLCNRENQYELFPAHSPFSDLCVIQCNDCEMAYTYPVPTDNFPCKGGSEYYGSLSNKFIPALQKVRDALMKYRARYFFSMLKKKTNTPKVLDVGCAEGRLLKAFYEIGCQCWGIEHKDYPASRFMCNESITYVQGDLESVELPDRSFDLIFLWHVLEHMNNPDNVIKKIAQLLGDNGVLILAVPNFSGIEAKVFKRSWFHLDVPWHKYHFTKKALKYLVEKNDLQIVTASTFCLEQGLYGAIQSFLNAMGWPKNELYEALKGNVSSRRIFPLTIQCCLSTFLLLPGLAFLFVASAFKKGPVIKLVLKRMYK